MELAKAIENEDTESVVHLAARIGQIKNIYESLGETFGRDDDEEEEAGDA